MERTRNGLFGFLLENAGGCLLTLVGHLHGLLGDLSGVTFLRERKQNNQAVLN
jgi:hypothetical protein